MPKSVSVSAGVLDGSRARVRARPTSPRGKPKSADVLERRFGSADPVELIRLR